jgi:hypothetical protein
MIIGYGFNVYDERILRARRWNNNPAVVRRVAPPKLGF